MRIWKAGWLGGLLLAGGFPEAGAQQAGEAAPGLDALEEIYREQLKVLHIPLLGDYLTRLQELAAVAPDPKPYEEEMARVQRWIAQGGVVDLRQAKRILEAKDGGMPPADPLPPLPVGRNWIVLTPDLAERTEPEVEITSSGAGVAVNEMVWRIEFLPPGSYEVVLRYASAGSKDLETPVRVELAGQRIDDEVPPVGRRGNGGEYRLANLGRITVPATLKGEPLTLKVLGGDTAEIVVYEVIVAPLNPMLRSRAGG